MRARQNRKIRSIRNGSKVVARRVSGGIFQNRKNGPVHRKMAEVSFIRPALRRSGEARTLPSALTPPKN
ncbi:MAG: hypothetical protein V4773_31110 [Verrucomicrobiota bacterium]